MGRYVLFPHFLDYQTLFIYCTWDRFHNRLFQVLLVIKQLHRFKLSFSTALLSYVPMSSCHIQKHNKHISTIISFLNPAVSNRGFHNLSSTMVRNFLLISVPTFCMTTTCPFMLELVLFYNSFPSV